MAQTYASEEVINKEITNNSTNDNTGEFVKNTAMNEEPNTSQVASSLKDTKVSEYLNGITTFIDKMKTLPQVGGGSAAVANERAKIAKLFDILSIEALRTELQSTNTQ